MTVELAEYWQAEVSRAHNYHRGVMLAECRTCGAPVTSHAILDGYASERDGRCAQCGVDAFCSYEKGKEA